MLDDIYNLYQETILDHCSHPRNYGVLAAANRIAHGRNPLCGDDIQLYVRVEDGVIQAIGFEGEGCAICKASCSLMTEALQGKPVQEAEALFQAFHQLLTSEENVVTSKEALGKLVVLEGVKQYPIRVKCATLAWHTLKAALDSAQEVVSTE